MRRTARSTSHGHDVRRKHGASVAAVLAGALAVGALAVGYVAFLLWPRWPAASAAPDAPTLPVTVAGELFVVPPAAIRVPLQRHAGVHERLDLAFLWPSLDAPDLTAKPVPSEDPPAPDRLFVTIAGADATLPPAARLKTIYARYLADEQFASGDGLVILNFRDGTPYQGEDLYVEAAAPERFMPRCSRPGAGATPGTCLYERRIGAADIMVRFPRDWLADWRGVAGGIDRLIAQVRPAGT